MNAKFTRSSILCLLSLLACAMLLTSCARPKQGAALPPVSIGVAEFSQPMTTADLLAGFMPEDTPRIDSKLFPQLDDALSDVLREETSRSYKGVSFYQKCREARAPGQTSRQAAMRHWTAVGQCMGVDYLIIPHVVELRERDGGEAGVITPAKIVMDLFLLDVKNGSILRSHYDETQAPLAANLLDTDKFIARGGKWVTAIDLAREGMQKGVKELGL